MAIGSYDSQNIGPDIHMNQTSQVHTGPEHQALN